MKLVQAVVPPTTTRMYKRNRQALTTRKNGHCGFRCNTHLHSAERTGCKMDITGKQIRVGTSNGQVENSTAMVTLLIPQVNAEFPTKGYIMPTFTNTLIGVGPICDANCTVVF